MQTNNVQIWQNINALLTDGSKHGYQLPIFGHLPHNRVN